MRLNPGISGLENFRDPGIRESRDPGIAIPNPAVMSRSIPGQTTSDHIGLHPTDNNSNILLLCHAQYLDRLHQTIRPHQTASNRQQFQHPAVMSCPIPGQTTSDHIGLHPIDNNSNILLLCHAQYLDRLHQTTSECIQQTTIPTSCCYVMLNTWTDYIRPHRTTIPTSCCYVMPNTWTDYIRPHRTASNQI